MAEEHAEADARATQGDGGDARTDEFCSRYFHDRILSGL
jgi:hypothetical protein